MNFDELKNAWDEESKKEINLPKNLEKLPLALSPIEKIKKNIKKEFYLQLVSFALLAFYPFLFQLNLFFLSLYFIIYLMLSAVSAVYFIKFRKFFNYMNHSALNSKDSLYEMYYEIKVNIEIYKSWNYAIIPFAIMIMMILVIGRMYYKTPTFFEKTTFLTSSLSLLLGVSFLTFFVFCSLAIHYWINYFYGKHLSKIKKLIDELKEN